MTVGRRLRLRPPAGTLRVLAVFLAAAMSVLAAAPAGAQQSPSCLEAPGFDDLDFWVGSWSVRVEGEEVGTNRIEKILDGCAVTERWRDVEGGEGRSLFYLVPALGTWRQVWVTERATTPGGVKEKSRVDAPGVDGVRFQGRIPLADGGSYLDRTTLTRLSDGRVRQHIEVSTDEGRTWSTTFDAVYVPAEDPRDG